MSWIQKLYETYERCAGAQQFATSPLLPVSHTTQQAHVEIRLDESGKFLGARAVAKEETLIPATEQSAARTSGEAPHPLCDKIQYCARDYPDHGGSKNSYFAGYKAELQAWCNSAFAHRKAKAVLGYISKGCVVADLLREGVLHVGDDGKLLTSWPSSSPVPDIFKNLTAKAGERDQGDALVRWRVETPGESLSATWEDKGLIESWVGYDASRRTTTGVCLVTGEKVLLAEQHPAKLRHGADKAKLISSNDTSGFTFRGRFENSDQACSVGFEVTQKAHNALRWLIARQAYRSGDQVIVAWTVSGKQIPNPCANTYEALGLQDEMSIPGRNQPGDVGQAFAQRLARRIAGYRAELGASEDVVVIGLDSATPGRMAIMFYRELHGFEFLDRLKAWHEGVAWQQRYSKDLTFRGAPSPKEIAEAAFGRRLDDKLRKATVGRLLPCIIDGQPVPRDLMQSAVRRAFNRAGLENWEWEKTLGVACALFRGYYRDRGYQMTLEHNRTTRDYLYGRLLAIADHLEGRALYVAGEKGRETSAARLMQRFADRPCSTWRTIELALVPYMARLGAKRPAFLFDMKKRLDGVVCAFQGSDFTNERPLSGEFLLGYHCQRRELMPKTRDEEESQEVTIDAGETA